MINAVIKTGGGISAAIGKSGGITAAIGKGGGSYPEYSGKYEVTPTLEEQRLETANKLLKDDVKIKAISRYDVTNTAGGTTVYIATQEVHES